MKKTALSPYLTVVSLSTVDASIFILAKGLIRNQMEREIPMVRYQLEVRSESGKVLGHHIGEIPKLKPKELRSFEVPLTQEGAHHVRIIRLGAFEK